MTTRPYELLARFTPDGTIAGVSVRTITTVNGRDYESDPAPLSGTTDPAFTAFAEQFAADAVTARDAALAHVTELTAEVDRLTALIPPPVDPNAVPATITRTQARLVLHRAGLLENVLKVIEAGGSLVSETAVETITWDGDKRGLQHFCNLSFVTNENYQLRVTQAGSHFLATIQPIGSTIN